MPLGSEDKVCQTWGNDLKLSASRASLLDTYPILTGSQSRGNNECKPPQNTSWCCGKESLLQYGINPFQTGEKIDSVPPPAKMNILTTR